MKRITQSSLADARIVIQSCSTPQNASKATQRCFSNARPILPSSKARTALFSQRCLHSTPTKEATISPASIVAPPPPAPVPSAEHVDSRVARRRKQAELLKRGQDMRDIAGGKGSGTAKTKRFWKDVHVKHADGMAFPLPKSSVFLTI